MAPLHYAAKFVPLLSLDCSTLAQSKERKGSNFALWQHWRFWREWAERRSLRAQKWTVSRVTQKPSKRGLIVGGVKSWRQKENMEIVELELCIVDHSKVSDT